MIKPLPPLRNNLADAKRDLDEVGLTRIVGAADDDLLDAVRARFDEQAAGEDAHGCAFRDDGAFVAHVPGAPNQRLWNLINKGEAFRRLILNETALALAKHLLGDDLLMFSMTANIANNGGAPQPLHGDQSFSPPETPYPLLVNCAWMLDAFTEENGATRVVPNSHRIGAWPEDGAEIETLPATGPAGGLMVWDGRLWHGTGENRTPTPRRGILAAYCRPFVRTQENSTLSASPEVLADASPELLSLLGFRSYRALGMVDGMRPGEFRSRPETYSGELRP